MAAGPTGNQILIEIQLNDGDIMTVYVPYVRLTFGSSFAYVLAQVGLALVLFGLAIWFMRRELVPIEHLGVGIGMPCRRQLDIAAADIGEEVQRRTGTVFGHSDSHGT